MSKKAVHVIVHGIVQGVGFRYFTHRRAQALGLGGFVRNTPEGTVEVVMEGDEPTVNEMLGLLRQGPRSGRVDHLEVSPIEYSGDFHSFGVRF